MLGLHTHDRNFGSCGVQVEKVRERIKNGVRQKQKFNLGPSALAVPRIFHSRIITIISSW